ncbi:MAG: methyltransferase domain-containing protein [Myxococcota bacterium]
MSTTPSDPTSSGPYRSGRYLDANPDWHEADAASKAQGLLPWLARLPEPPSRVLEVGCGTGAVLATLKERLDPRWPACAWEGWDIAGEAIRRARERRGPRIRFVCGDVLAAEVTADVCLTVDVVEHIADDEGFLAAIAGRAPWHLLRIPLELSALDVLRPARLLAARERYGHLHHYSRELVLDRLDRSGLTVVGTAYHRVPVAPKTRRGRLFAPVRRGLEALAPHLAARAIGGVSLVVWARGSTAWNRTTG